jgi:radial spoke head protein 4/6
VKYPDITNDANLYEWAGISFGKAEIYRLYLSIKAFAAELPSEVERIRLFGKITTRNAPYYVIEGLTAEDEDVDEAIQETRAGANKYTYWVTQRVDAADGWVKLPNVTCDQTVVARQIKRLLTGDLSSPVPSYPPFSGTEKNLLRAQIAIILGETSISPDGFFELDDSEPALPQPVDAETLAGNFPKASSDLNFAEAWKHHETKLNKIGRITAPPEKLDENGDVIEPDESAEVVESLSATVPEEWTFRVAPGGAGTASGSTVIARSLAWPGAVSIASGSRFLNIYVGNAVRFSATSYCPPPPSTIQSEFVTAEDDAFQLIEQADTRVDPTPPQPEDEAEEED